MQGEQTKLPISVPRWRAAAVRQLRTLRDEISKSAPAPFLKTLDRAIAEANGKKRKKHD